ncbi:sensor histidine kinase [Clostridium isatidis]|uniref:sensor histidine kinase n=1 Tax=Clostridium isatidis TaxID=182773 RepID=UPI003AABDA2F
MEFLKAILVNKHINYCKIIIILQIIFSFLFSINFIESSILLTSISLGEYFIYDLNKIKLGSIIYFIPIYFIKNSNEISTIFISSIILLISIINDSIKKGQLLKYSELEIKQGILISNLNNKLIKEKDMQEQILHTARLEERNEISIRLHDKIGHTISGTLLQLEAAKIIFDVDPKKSISILDSCINNLREGMDDIRAVLRNIRPKEEELGINRIKKILDEKIKGTNIKGKVKYEGDLEKISFKIWLLFIQVTTEITTNSIKYSNCDLIAINLEVLKKFIKLEIKDNGIGCQNIKKGIGISSIEERVENLGGKLILNGDEGFSVIILIPY